MKILITGAKGFSGRHLCKLLRKDPTRQIYPTDLPDCNLTQKREVEALLEKVLPDQIYHLAGTFSNQYEKDYECNVSATKNILDFLKSSKLPCRVLLIGSAAEYGIPNKNPIDETHPLSPRTIYGLTKVFQTQLMNYYVSTHGLDLVMARTFNLKGVGAPRELFIGSLYAQISEIKKGKQTTISLGDLRAERDYIDIDCAAIHYQNIMCKGATGNIYNVASGRPTKISELLHNILEENELSEEIIEQNNNHKIGVPQIYADVQKLTNL